MRVHTTHGSGNSSPFLTEGHQQQGAVSRVAPHQQAHNFGESSKLVSPHPQKKTHSFLSLIFQV